MPFADRHDAGRRLAAKLDLYASEDPIVLALPRGGVPVAWEVARRLGATLDVFVARKLGAPAHPEYGFGAVAPGGVRVLDGGAVRALGLSDRDIDAVCEREEREIARRLAAYRGDRPLPDLEGRTVILVDDGLATGGTVRAAIAAIRAQDPRRLVLAVPVGPPDTVRSLAEDVDDVVVLETPESFGAVGLWYRNFEQTSDREVLDLLGRAPAGSPGRAEG